MTSSVIPARLEFQCGHAALVSLPRIKGETSAQRNERIAREKVAAQTRACDFCGPDVAIVVQAAAPEADIADTAAQAVAEALADLEAVAEVAALVAAAEEEEEKEAPLAPAIEAIEATSVAAQRNATAPVAAQRETSAPVAAQRNATAPVAAQRETSAPVAAQRETSAPVAAQRETSAPLVVQPAARKTRVRRTAAVAQALRQYTVKYRVERVIAASDIGDALRRVAELGATDVLAITRA